MLRKTTSSSKDAVFNCLSKTSLDCLICIIVNLYKIDGFNSFEKRTLYKESVLFEYLSIYGFKRVSTLWILHERKSVLIPFYSFNYRLNLKKISLVLAKRYMFLGNSTNQLFNFNTKKFLREGEIDRFHKNICVNSEETIPINKSFRL